MIDYYYEFPANCVLLEKTIDYAILRNYHPDDDSEARHTLHNHCYMAASRVWLENANGAILIRSGGRDVHDRINAREMTWIKLRAQELEI